MRRYLSLVVLPILVLASSFLPLFLGTASASTQSDASALCKNIEPYNGKTPSGKPQPAPQSNDLYDACVSGYTQEKLAPSSSETAYCNSLTFSGARSGACTAGWEAAKNHTTPGSPGSQASTTAQVVCAPFSGDKLTFCQQALGSQCSSYTSSTTTDTLNKQATDCFNGAWAQHNGDPSPCGSLSGTEKTACSDGFTKTAAPSSPSTGPTTPTCDNSGNPLSWFLCPVFDLVSEASHWIFQGIVQPFLITTPISTDSSDPSYQIWSNFRIYGDIFLLFGLLAIVLSETIGGGLIDAYTVKKVLPRLLIAAVLINLSIYIVALMVDISNILGQGVSALLTSPLQHCHAGSGNCWDFQLTTGDTLRVFSVGILGFLATSTAAIGFIMSIFLGGFAAVNAAITAAFFVGLPVLFAIIGVFLTLIFRKGLILLLVLVSPVAFALYCLPNTERFFKRWWDLLVEALLVYPIIVAIFGVADILSITILQSNSISPSDFSGTVSYNLGRTLALVTAFLLQFLPLLAIPFAFRFASGAMRRIYDAATTAGAKVNDLTKGRTEQAKADYRAQSFAGRARAYHAAQDFGARHNGPLGVGRRASRWAARRAGGYNIESLMSAGRAETSKQLNDQINTGRDEEIRGLTVNRRWALAQGELNAANGYNNGHVRRGSNGELEYRTLGGAWIGEQDVEAGHRRWGNNQFAQQAALSYEMRKSITEEQSDYLADHFDAVATGPGGWGMSRGEAAGTFKGAAFENQNQHLEYKYANAATGALDDDGSFVDEIYERRGSYNMAQMNSRTIEQLKVAHQMAGARGDTDQQEKIAAIAQTFMHEVGSGGVAGMAGEENDIPIPGQTAPRRMANTPGAAHVAERVRELAQLTGAYAAEPTGPYTDPGHAPTPNDRNQT